MFLVVVVTEVVIIVVVDGIEVVVETEVETVVDIIVDEVVNPGKVLLKSESSSPNGKFRVSSGGGGSRCGGLSLIGPSPYRLPVILVAR